MTHKWLRENSNLLLVTLFLSLGLLATPPLNIITETKWNLPCTPSSLAAVAYAQMCRYI